MERRERQRQPIFIAFAVAIVLAPFLALLLSVKAGLALLIIALTACGLLLHGAMAGAPPKTHRWVRVVVVTNLVLAVLCAVALVYLLTR